VVVMVTMTACLAICSRRTRGTKNEKMVKIIGNYDGGRLPSREHHITIACTFTSACAAVNSLPILANRSNSTCQEFDESFRYSTAVAYIICT
jgi:hypothetical protein